MVATLRDLSHFAGCGRRPRFLETGLTGLSARNSNHQRSKCSVQVTVTDPPHHSLMQSLGTHCVTARWCIHIARETQSAQQRFRIQVISHATIYSQCIKHEVYSRRRKLTQAPCHSRIFASHHPRMSLYIPSSCRIHSEPSCH